MYLVLTTCVQMTDVNTRSEQGLCSYYTAVHYVVTMKLPSVEQKVVHDVDHTLIDAIITVMQQQYTCIFKFTASYRVKY